MRKARTTLLLGLVAALTAGAAFAQVDFTRYVALGDSLTAGVVNFGSVETYQKNSVPALIARQAGITGFQQPLVSEPGLPPLLYLKALAITPLGVSPDIEMKSGAGAPLNAALPVPYNNLGIDGANTLDLLTRTGNIYNLAADFGQYAAGAVGKNVPFSDLVLRFPVFPGTTTPATAVAQAIALQPTFITVAIGSNEALGAAESAVVLEGVTLTTKADFQTQYTQLLGALRQTRPNASIMVATIQDVLPFVTTIKPYIVNPADGSHIPLIGESGPLSENDYVTLLASSLLARGIGIPQAAGGTGQPLPEGSIDATGLHAGVILRAAEMGAIIQRIGEYNDVIKSVAAAVGAKVVDLNAVYRNWNANGVLIGGIQLTTSFLTGGMFGYDGVHPSALGYALVAREWIKAINSNFGTKLADIDLRPFLTGEGAASATSVMASNVVISEESAVAMVKAYAPYALTDKLQPGHVIHRRLAGRGTTDGMAPQNP